MRSLGLCTRGIFLRIQARVPTQDCGFRFREDCVNEGHGHTSCLGISVASPDLNFLVVQNMGQIRKTFSDGFVLTAETKRYKRISAIAFLFEL